MFSIREYFLNLNLFQPAHDSGEIEDEQQHHTNIIATRIYLVILVSALISLAFFTWWYPETVIVTLKHPTKEQFKIVPFEAQCACSRISLPFSDFTSLAADFHAVCSSDFVSNRWITAIFSGSNSSYFDPLDFRNFGSAQFQTLTSLCHLSKTYVQQSINSFSMSALLSPQPLSEYVFQSQAQASIDQFQLTSENTFTFQLQILRQMTIGNQLMSGLQTNTYPLYRANNLEQTGDFDVYLQWVGYLQKNGSYCDCRMNLDCVSPAVIYDGFGMISWYIYYNPQLLMSPRGILAGCLPLTSLLFSTLECFYNQTCLDELIAFFPTTEQFTAMTIPSQSVFNTNSTVKSIVERLMVEKWIANISYEKYYDQCAPISCFYSKTQQHDILFVLEKLISLLSGLTLVLGLIIPIIVRFVRRPRNPHPNPQIPLRIHWHQLKADVKKAVMELNIFKHYPSNDRQMRHQRNATRLYILLILISLIILTFYTSFTVKIYREIVVQPSESQYIHLQEIHSSSLSCPCTSISMNHSSLITMEPHFHQVCSSDLISAEWIHYNTLNQVFESNLDYRLNAGAQFQLLGMLCQQAQQTIRDALQVFLETPFVVSQVISKQVYEAKMNASIQNWQQTVVKQFQQTIQLIRTMTQGNQLTDGRSNAAWDLNDISRDTTMELSVYSNCSCRLSQKCRSPMSVYGVDGITGLYYIRFTIPNFFLGCFRIEALLQTTLECFYNRSCMTLIDSLNYEPLGAAFNFSALDGTLNSPYETVESIVNRLMIDSWSSDSDVFFSKYYNACAPMSCTFEYQDRNNLFAIITTVIGLFGGLSLGFNIIILIVLRFIEKMRNNFSRLALIRLIKDLFICTHERQMISRLHFVLLTVSLCVIYIFSAFKSQLIIVTIDKPSLSTYEDLLTRFPDSLQCSCSEISIQYESFLTIVPRFHQVCSSEFISNEWIAYLYGDGNLTSRFAPTDFLYSASVQFQILAALCQLSQKTVNNTLSQLGTNVFINTYLLSSNLLDERIRTTINEFQVIMPNLFISILSLIRETTGSNMILTALASNWVFSTPPFLIGWGVGHMVPLTYQGCSCGLSSKCVLASRGMLAGCYPLEALLQSPLSCLYDQQCIDSNQTFQAMNISSSIPSRFNINETIESIVNQLMVEEYFSNASYEKYFAACTPLSCIYSYADHTNFIDGITRLITLYGGLVIICRWIAIIIIKKFPRGARRIHPIID